MKTLLLDVANWDLVADASGNIAVAAEPYAYAQDVACAIRLFLGELWYDKTDGIDYFGEILGKAPPIQVFKERMIAAALTVPGVVSAECVIDVFENREVTGSVRFRDENGDAGVVSF